MSDEEEKAQREFDQMVRAAPKKMAASYVAVIITTLVLSVLTRAWAVFLMWNWFVRPLGFGRINIQGAAALVFLVNIFSSGSGQPTPAVAVARIKARGWSWALFEASVDLLLPVGIVALMGWLLQHLV